MSSIKTTMTLDAQQVIAEQKRAGESMAGVVQAYKDASNEAARLSSVASRALRDALSPAEKYEQKIEDLGRALKAGKLNEEQYAKAVAHTKQKFQESEQAGSKLTGAVTTLAATAGGILSLSTAVGFFRDALEDSHEEAKAIAELLKSSFASRGSLAQVATSASDYADLQKQSAEFRSQGGATTRQMADGIVFALRSTGLSDEASLFQRVGRTGLVDAAVQEPLINAIDSMRDAFSVAEAGNAESILSKALVASAVSQVPAQALVSATARAGASAAALKFSDEETLSGIATLTDPLGSPEEAATRMNALLRAIEKKNINKGSLGGTLDFVSGELAAGKDIREVLGEESEAIQAYRLLSAKRTEFGQLSADITTANDGRALADKFAILEGDRTQRALGIEQATAGTRDIAQTEMGRREVLTQSLLQQEAEVERLRGTNAFYRYGRKVANELPFLGVRDSATFQGSLMSGQQIEDARREATATGNTDLLRMLTLMEQTQKELAELIRGEKAERARRSTAPSIPAPEN